MGSRKRLPDEDITTLKAVAWRAGVSTATVSRVLNGSGNVNAQARDSVLRAVAALNYVPHGAARALASRRTRTIGAIVPTLQNAIFAECLDALQQRINAARFVLLVATSEYDAERESAELSALLERGVDAMMLVGREHSPFLYGMLRSQRVPFVLTWTSDIDAERPCIGFDNREAARRLANYLLDLGHRRFAMIAGIRRGNDRAFDRVAGVQDALSARGLTLDPTCFLERSYAMAEGRAAMAALLKLPVPPTAVICGNDVLAFGALAACRSRGVAVPGEVSIAGFDDIETASYVVPSLTTIRVRAAEIGARAADYLLGRLRAEPMLDAIDLGVELVVRESTGPPPS